MNEIFDEFEKGNSLVLQNALARGLLHDSDLQLVIWRETLNKIKKFDASKSCLILAMQPLLPDII